MSPCQGPANMSNERESMIIYSPFFVHDIRKKDPDFKALAARWEQVFGGPVTVEEKNDRLIVKAAHAPTVHPDPS